MTSAVPPSYTASNGVGGTAGEPENFGDQAMEFLKAAGEMALEFGKGCRDIVVQSFGDDESYLVKTFGKGSYIEKRVRGPCEKVCGKLRFFNDYLPEDKDPFHVWMVILSVSVFVLAGEFLEFACAVSIFLKFIKIAEINLNFMFFEFCFVSLLRFLNRFRAPSI